MKRETSVSVSDLQDLTGISDSVKRLALRDSSSLPPSSFLAPESSPPSTPKQSTKASDTPPHSPLELSPAHSLSRAESASPTGSSGYISSEQVFPSPRSTVPLSIKIPIAPLFHPEHIMQHDSSSAVTANGRTFSQGGTVLETICDRNAFANKYDIIKEIGRGGFSTVYQCRLKANPAKEYAVKIVDLRPLRLREKFNPARLRREIDIMKRLQHPNIVEFIEGFETEEQLLMVMELCPGEELFDVILARQKFSEQDAKPVFAQVVRALHYLHCLNIIHRDVKPENILILHRKDSSGNSIAKLLDFGLSKNAGAGSAAKTFVGTPCYLSPEVEYTSKGLGGTYGLPADCWSLGAVLYVMLVARFPEFEHDPATDKIVLRLPPQLWDDISPEAKHLVRALMNTNPNARMTTREVLLHSWLGPYRSTPGELDALQLASYDLGQNLQEEAEAEAHRMGSIGDFDEMTAGGIAVHRQAMVLRQHPHHHSQHNHGAPPALGVDQLQLAPLLRLQRSIAHCFAEAHTSYQDFPEVATQVRRGAALCRQQFNESSKMLSKVEQTAQAVLGIFPDLILAVEDGEPQLAAEFFNVVREWVVELRELVSKTQQANHASMAQIQTIVEKSTLRLQSRARERKGLAPKSLILPKKLLDIVKQMNGVHTDSAAAQEADGSSMQMGADEGESETLTAEQVMDLFMGLFGQSPSGTGSSSPVSTGSGGGGNGNNTSMSGVSSAHSQEDWDGGDGVDVDDVDGLSSDSIMMDDGAFDAAAAGVGPIETAASLSLQPITLTIPTDNNAVATAGASSSLGSPVAASRLAEALHKLRQVDMILEQLSVFWANTEVVLDMLTKKGQHVERLIGFSQKPRLMARFHERMHEYTRFWEGVSTLCKNYASGVSQGQGSPQSNYSFLDSEDTGMFHDLIRSSSSVNLASADLPVTGGRVDKLDSL